MKYLILLSLLVSSAVCHAGESPNSMTKEINYLLDHLESSGCKFNRNGSWHSGSEASAHLRKKYKYLLSKNQLQSTESFIKKAASESSISGKPYEVQCKGTPVVLSNAWFKNELNIYRNLENTNRPLLKPNQSSKQ